MRGTFWNEVFRFVSVTLEKAYGRERPIYVFIVRTEHPLRLRAFLRRRYPDFDEQEIRER